VSFSRRREKKWELQVLESKESPYAYFNCCLRNSAIISEGVLFAASAFVFSFAIKSASSVTSIFRGGFATVTIFTSQLYPLFARTQYKYYYFSL